jgi:hypothetical protein
LLSVADTGWFCFIYSLTFGGFVGLASYLTIFFRDQYHLSKVQVGDFTIVVVFDSFLRPVGGMLAANLLHRWSSANGERPTSDCWSRYGRQLIGIHSHQWSVPFTCAKNTP